MGKGKGKGREEKGEGGGLGEWGKKGKGRDRYVLWKWEKRRGEVCVHIPWTGWRVSDQRGNPENHLQTAALGQSSPSHLGLCHALVLTCRTRENGLKECHTTWTHTHVGWGNFNITCMSVTQIASPKVSQEVVPSLRVCPLEPSLSLPLLVSLSTQLVPPSYFSVFLQICVCLQCGHAHSVSEYDKPPTQPKMAECHFYTYQQNNITVKFLI